MSRSDVVDRITAARSAEEARAPVSASKSGGMFGKDGMSFSDVLDIVNPLQHIPIVATVYRQLTGATISPAARIIGDGIYGGPIGVVAGSIDAMVEDTSGRDIGGNLVAMAFGDDTPAGKTAESTILASAPTTDARVTPAAATTDDTKLALAPATKLATPAAAAAAKTDAPRVGPAHGPWTGPETVSIAQADGSSIEVPWWIAAQASETTRTSPRMVLAAYSTTLLAKGPSAVKAPLLAKADDTSVPTEGTIPAASTDSTAVTTAAPVTAIPAPTVAPGLIQPKTLAAAPPPGMTQEGAGPLGTGQPNPDGSTARVPQVAFPSHATGLSTTAGLPSAGGITSPAALMALESNVKQGQAATGAQTASATTGAPGLGPNGLKPLPPRNNFTGGRQPIATSMTSAVSHGPALPRVDVPGAPIVEPVIIANSEAPVAPAPTPKPTPAPAVTQAAAPQPTPVVASADVSAAMMQALDKYENLMKSRGKTVAATTAQ